MDADTKIARAITTLMMLNVVFKIAQIISSFYKIGTYIFNGLRIIGEFTRSPLFKGLEHTKNKMGFCLPGYIPGRTSDVILINGPLGQQLKRIRGRRVVQYSAV